jgi:hypothetical protein
MTGPNFAHFVRDFRQTGQMWAIDRETGAVRPIPTVQFLIIEGTREASIYTFKPTAGQAYAEQARVLAAIAQRN